MNNASEETKRISERYARRKNNDIYSFLNPDVWQGVHERQRRLVRLFRRLGMTKLEEVRLLDVGCGDGSTILEFIRMGMQPDNITGIELLDDRVARAKMRLPASVRLISGDALKADISEDSFDVVFQSVVFSSILDNEFQRKLAEKMWGWVAPGGGVLWYDFTYDNPRNPDVRGVSAKRVRQLFPDGEIMMKRITLAPPISRIVCRFHPHAYHLFNMFPFLRTHLLCWIAKK